MKFYKELLNVLLVLVPVIYLAGIYSSLPAMIPTHWNIHGQADDWGHKWSLWMLPTCLPLFVYIIFAIVPTIDPKRRINNMGKYGTMKFVTLLFMSSLGCFILYMTQHPTAPIQKFILALVGLFLAIIGNFFPTLKPNYFIGIRSPWALENETVWRKTHLLGGRLWVVGGVLLVITTFVLPQETLVASVGIPLILIMAFVPIVYSYIVWRKVRVSH